MSKIATKGNDEKENWSHLLRDSFLEQLLSNGKSSRHNLRIINFYMWASINYVYNNLRIFDPSSLTSLLNKLM